MFSKASDADETASEVSEVSEGVVTDCFEETSDAELAEELSCRRADGDFGVGCSRLAVRGRVGDAFGEVCVNGSASERFALDARFDMRELGYLKDERGNDATLKVTCVSASWLDSRSIGSGAPVSSSV